MKYESLLNELFGSGIEGVKIGDYAGEPLVGVRDKRSEMQECDACGMMPVGGSCGCDHGDGEDDGTECPDCGMLVVDGACGCDQMSDVCPACGMIPVEGSCDCAMNESVGACAECGMSQGMCECGMTEMSEADCSECGMAQGMCECGMTEGKKKRKGPSKATAKKILGGAVTATEKAKKVDSWASNKWATANWMSKRAGVPFHGKKKK